MSYFIFLKDFENLPGSLYRIAENQSDLDSLNINKFDYKIIEDSQENFNNVKYGIKSVEKYINDTITYLDIQTIFANKEDLRLYINYTQTFIKNFIDFNQNHSQFNKWNDYYIQLKNTNLNNIVFPLNKSFSFSNVDVLLFKSKLLAKVTP
jgi:hypothetical protein